jgi:hypothetical protein
VAGFVERPETFLCLAISGKTTVINQIQPGNDQHLRRQKKGREAVAARPISELFNGLRRQDSNTSSALNASASTMIHGSATVEKSAPGVALIVSKRGERNSACTNVPRRPADPVAGAISVLLEGWNEGQDASRLRRGLLALLAALDP